MGAGNSFCFFSIAHRMGLLGLKNDKVGALYDIWVSEQKFDVVERYGFAFASFL
jgi:hypothetical protein